MIFKLGKKDPIPGRKCLVLGDYLLQVPTAPIHPPLDEAPNLNYPMDLNDQYGDCTVAGYDHFKETVTYLLKGTGINLTEQQIIDFYKTQNPGFPQEDNGMVIQLFLEYLVNNGIIVAFAKINLSDQEMLKAGIFLGLAVIAGVQLQEAQQQQFPNTWSYVLGSPIVGGHCITINGYDSVNSLYKVVSWGKEIDATAEFIEKQTDEIWFVITQDHLDNANFSRYLGIQNLSKDVSIITDGKINIPVPVAPALPVLKLTNPLTHNDFVKTLQTKLNANGASPVLTVDGWFGQMTQSAVIVFQEAHKLTVDGIVGPNTWSALNTSTSIAPSTIALIASFEGCSLTPYQDTAGVWTIGYGFTQINGQPVTASTPPLTQQEADAFLTEQVKPYAQAVSDAIKVPLNQNQFDACTSLCYNVGMAGFTLSTVARDCNNNDFQGAAQAFLLWDQVNGQVSEGLLARRKAEMNLFLTL
jgi:lysozyme